MPGVPAPARAVGPGAWGGRESVRANAQEGGGMTTGGDMIEQLSKGWDADGRNVWVTLREMEKLCGRGITLRRVKERRTGCWIIPDDGSAPVKLYRLADVLEGRNGATDAAAEPSGGDRV